MKSKFLFLIKTSLLKKIKNKTFIIVNIVLAVALICLTNIDRIVSSFGGNFSKTNNIMIVDKTNKSYEIIKNSIDNTENIIETNTSYKIKKIESEEVLRKNIKEEKDIGIILDYDDKNVIDAKIITYGYINTNIYQLLQNSINSSKQVIAMQKMNIDPKDLKVISEPIEIEREYIESGKNKDEETINMVMSVVTPVVILPFFMLIILVIQMIGAEINEEKSTKGMEIIISNVSAKTHFFSKILSANLFVLIQAVLLLVYGGIGMLIRGNKGLSMPQNLGEISSYIESAQKIGLLDKIYSYIPFVLVLMLITIFAYSILAGILASMTTNMEDFQQLQTPMIIISLIGFYLSIMNTLFDGSLFIRIVSYIPFISAILSPSLLLTGVIGFEDILLSILLMVVTISLLLKYGLRIYKEGILNYSGSNLWRKMLKALKSK